MRFNKQITIAALIAAVGAAGTALAQTAYVDDPQGSPQASMNIDKGTHMLSFKDQGNSPESDPAAHLLLIKDTRPMETATIQTTTQTTTVADAAPAPAPVDTRPAATAADTSNALSNNQPETSTADVAPMPAPRADRN
jgi:hypothetical protein